MHPQMSFPERHDRAASYVYTKDGVAEQYIFVYTDRPVMLRRTFTLARMEGAWHFTFIDPATDIPSLNEAKQSEDWNALDYTLTLFLPTDKTEVESFHTPRALIERAGADDNRVIRRLRPPVREPERPKGEPPTLESLGIRDDDEAVVTYVELRKPGYMNQIIFVPQRNYFVLRQISRYKPKAAWRFRKAENATDFRWEARLHLDASISGGWDRILTEAVPIRQTDFDQIEALQTPENLIHNIGKRVGSPWDRMLDATPVGA